MEFKEKSLESNNSSNNNYNDSTQNSSLKDTSEDLYTKREASRYTSRNPPQGLAYLPGRQKRMAGETSSDTYTL